MINYLHNTVVSQRNMEIDSIHKRMKRLWYKTKKKKVNKNPTTTPLHQTNIKNRPNRRSGYYRPPLRIRLLFYQSITCSGG